ncbi:MAG: hypothetical protein DHS20C13_03660 [Thermodesulfobacteriota bacterium]|nr:MAG: hypothetical protein DHS20C13_03660 [Thermodesulfobacteriota bacterium]
MKKTLLLLVLLLFTACSGGKNNEVNEHELYGKKRVDCTNTKSTDEAANVTQCANIRPDAKEIKDTSNNFSETESDSSLRIIKLPDSAN